MKPKPNCTNYICRVGIFVAAVLSIIPARANPISMPEKSLTPEISFFIGSAILLEVICIWWILLRSRRPRFFILWLIGMHVVTYPLFLSLLWFLNDMRPASAVAIGEGLVVLFEGILIYLLCRFVVSAKPELAAPSIVKCWLASLVGNVCSAAAFPVLIAIFERFSPS